MALDLETAKLLLDAISFIARLTARLRGPSQVQLEELEVSILDYLARRREWTTPGLVWADLILLPILRDVRFDEAFPPESGRWDKLKWRLRNLRVNGRHRWRMWRHLIPEDTVVKATRRLWRDGKLRRAPWDELYTVRYD